MRCCVLIIRLGTFLYLILVASSVSAETWTRFDAGDNLAGSAEIMPSTDARRGWSGFSFAVEFAASSDYSGIVVQKPGVFALDVSGSPENRLYTFRMVGTNVYIATLKENILKALEPAGNGLVAHTNIRRERLTVEQLPDTSREHLYEQFETVQITDVEYFKAFTSVVLPDCLGPMMVTTG